MRDALRHFPARPLTLTERGLVAQWLAGAGDVASAYISNRRTDDPDLHHRVVVFTKVDDGPTHIVHAPSGRDVWIVLTLGQRTKVQRYRTLRAALNSIRSVLVGAESETVFSRSKLI
jgi:hypothetical protein